MRKNITLFSLLFISIVYTSCVNDAYLADPPVVPNQSFVEEFDTAMSAYNRGWRFVNKSEPIGITDFGNYADLLNVPFEAYSSRSKKNGYLWTDYQSTSADKGTISSFAVSPAVYMKNGDQIMFYTRAQLYKNAAGDSTDYINRLQVCINTENTGLNCGSGVDAGNYNNVILDINPFYKEFLLSEFLTGVAQKKGAYPHRWTRFTATVYGLNKPTWGRFAFRYFVEDGGSNGNGTSIGIDSVAYIAK